MGALNPCPDHCVSILLFNGFSSVNYCSVTQDSCGKTLAARLQKLQNRAASVLIFSGLYADTDYLIERLGGQNLDSQRKYHTAFMVYRSINVLAPEYLSKLLASSNSVTSYSLGDTEEQTNFSSAQHKLALAIEVGVSGAVY